MALKMCVCLSAGYIVKKYGDISWCEGNAYNNSV